MGCGRGRGRGRGRVCVGECVGVGGWGWVGVGRRAWAHGRRHACTRACDLERECISQPWAALCGELYVCPQVSVNVRWLDVSWPPCCVR